MDIHQIDHGATPEAVFGTRTLIHQLWSAQWHACADRKCAFFDVPNDSPVSVQELQAHVGEAAERRSRIKMICGD